MNLKTKLKTITVFGGAISLGIVAVLTGSLSSQQSPHSVGAGEQPLPTDVEHYGPAEAKRVSNKITMFYPHRQPEVYWRDPDWNIDLVIPPSSDDPYSLSIRPSGGRGLTVELPETYEQVNSISRAPGDKAIVVADLTGTTQAVAIIDLKLGKVIDNIGLYNPTVSPNRRFILYENWYPPHAETHENVYHLYDTMKSPKENVCGYRSNDPKHEDLDEGMRGFQVFPQRSGQVLCTDLEDDNDDNMASNFVWADDSSKIVFADVKRSVMSLILVTAPLGSADLPRTFVHPLKGAENVCLEAKYCDFHVIKSLTLEDESVKLTVFPHPESGKKVENDLIIPISRFVPVGK